jgi:acyl-CoA thioesterase FadM
MVRRMQVAAHIPRHAFSVRETVRAADVWRVFQEMAIEGSAKCGWPPSRYLAEKTGFVVRQMIVLHAQEVRYGEDYRGETWVSRMRREMLSTREVRLLGPRGLMSAGTQEWVHVTSKLEPLRAGPALLDAFPVEPDREPPLELPKVTTPLEFVLPKLCFRLFHVSMDPLDHANHPAYVDYAEEAIACAMHQCGGLPLDIKPVGEAVRFRSGARGGEMVRVETKHLGLSEDGASVFAAEVFAGERVAASATLVRSLGSGGALAEVLRNGLAAR